MVKIFFIKTQNFQYYFNYQNNVLFIASIFRYGDIFEVEVQDKGQTMLVTFDNYESAHKLDKEFKNLNIDIGSNLSCRIKR